MLWARILDRLDGPDPPRIVCVDPRRTPVAERADVHLPILNGTNMALMNALTHELIARGAVDRVWVDAHTVGFADLERLTADTTPEWAAEICAVPAADIRRAAEIFATSDRVVSTCSMGFYQSHQATAASCAVNNLHLLRGMLGRPGAGILQMNGQPSAENNREAGCGAALPGFRNWANLDHVRELAELWNVDIDVIPHRAGPTPAMEIMRLVEEGSIGFLWIAGTNPAVSMPDTQRIRSLLGGDQCFVVVSDGYRTETSALAVVTTEVRDAADGWVAVEGSVGASAVVPPYPAWEGLGAVGACGVGVAVAPLAQRGLDEPFGLAVGARGVWAGAEMLQVEAAAGVGPEAAFVGVAVVGHDLAACDAVVVEVGDGTLKERR